MADNDSRGQMNLMMRLLFSETWRELWVSLNLPVRTFSDLGLDANTPDAQLWHACPREQVVLITSNRNEDGPNSLGATIQANIAPTTLPVFTLSDPKKILRDGDYANAVVEKLLEYLLEIDRVRGTGRLWLP